MIAQTRRVDRGRGHSYVLDGEPVPGVTTILDKGVPKPALIGWAANATADYAQDHWDELVELKPSERRKRLGGARFEVVNAASKRGTNIHRLAHRLAAGEEVDVPDEDVGYIDAYLRFIQEWQPDEIVVEGIVVNREYRYMGTVDLVARLADGHVWILDWKTALKGLYPELALQLAAYRFCEVYLGPDGQELAMPVIDRAGGIHLRDDGYDLVPVEAERQQWITFLHAMEVARFTDEPRERLIGEAIRPPEREGAAA